MVTMVTMLLLGKGLDWSEWLYLVWLFIILPLFVIALWLALDYLFKNSDFYNPDDTDKKQ
jgi:hypothetical protein